MAKVIITTLRHWNIEEDFKKFHKAITKEYLDKLVIGKNLFTDIKVYNKAPAVVTLGMNFEYFEDAMDAIAKDLHIVLEYKITIEDRYIAK